MNHPKLFLAVVDYIEQNVFQPIAVRMITVPT